MADLQEQLTQLLTQPAPLALPAPPVPLALPALPAPLALPVPAPPAAPAPPSPFPMAVDADGFIPAAVSRPRAASAAQPASMSAGQWEGRGEQWEGRGDSLGDAWRMCLKRETISKYGNFACFSLTYCMRYYK